MIEKEQTRVWEGNQEHAGPDTKGRREFHKIRAPSTNLHAAEKASNKRLKGSFCFLVNKKL